ncbi:MAG: hypothetical protein EOO53_16840 [Gammaproteobacteria bacterium]|nr:MAG: hypothetical protein EOO53_16840 [Gammaproteobacteria bacterium]
MIHFFAKSFFKKIINHCVFAILLTIFFVSASHAATYNLTSAQYPPCDTTNVPAWSVSGTTYTCNGDGRVILASGDVLTANTAINIVAARGFSLTSNTIGSASANINLISSYNTVVSSGTSTLYGYIQHGGAITLVGVTVSGAVTGSGNVSLTGGNAASVQSTSGEITLSNVAVSGAVTANGNVNLSGGSVGGLVTSSGNTITTNGTSLLGGSTSQSGISITGGTLAGAFKLTGNNPATFSGVTMTSGSISGASTVSISSSTMGSSSASIAITSTSGAVSLSSSTVYGVLTAPSYSTINVPSGSAVYGTCSPGSTPANACVTAPPTCTSGFIGGITGSYFNNKTLTGTATGTRLDTSINFDWGSGAPGVSTVGADNFSVRWSGSIRAPVTGSYIFQTISDDGVRLWVNGQQIINNWTDHSATTNNSSSIVLTSGQSYTIVMEFYESGGSAVAKLNWLVPGYGTYSAISTQAATNPSTAASCPISAQTCSGGGLMGGASGKYYNNTNLTGTAAATRIDTAIDFNWDAGSPGVTGVGADNFSVRWDGYLRATTSGNYQFETVSDDGVRVWVNNQLIIDNWTSHSQTTDTSSTIALTAGTNYPVRVEYFEAGGVSIIALHWKTPSDSSFVSIPTCPSTVAYYGISHSGSGITCAGEPITITAYDNLGSTVAPTVGTQLALSTSPTTGTWVGGNTYSFSGGEMTAVKYLQQTTASTLNINVTDGTYAESSGLDPNITFVTSAIKFYNNATTVGLQNQVAGMGNSNAVLKALRTDNNTGACIAQVTGTKTVKLGFQCVNPTTCISGQNFTVKGSTINSNAASVTTANISYSNLSLTFDSTGTAPIPMVYPDVGRLTLFAQMTLPASGNDPAITWSDSNSFVVKPYTLAIPVATDSLNGIQTTGGVNNLGGSSATGTSAQFVSAGTPFRVKVQAWNSSNLVAPNFGNETISERDNMQVKAVGLVYPSGGTLTPLVGAGTGTFTTAITPAGTWLNSSVVWNQVGSITLKPELSDADYLTAGDVYVTPAVSGTVGRFYPDHYRLTASALTNSCGIFSYMGQPNLNLSYTLQAETLGNAVLSNYGGNYANTLPTSSIAKPNYVAEDNDGANGGALSSRVVPGTVPSWVNGIMQFATSAATFSRQALPSTPEGPFTSLQWGLYMQDAFDARSLTNPNMSAQTTGTCTSTTCTEATLGSPLVMRYGRLRLDDAFGPETVSLPVNFITEYWTAGRFVVNASDSCTLLPRSAVTYPAGTLVSDGNRTVSLSGGTTQGTYTSLTTNTIGFNAGNAGQVFTAPTGAAQGSFVVSIDLTNLPWLQFDWDQGRTAGPDARLPNATFTFGSYRGNDRVIYWRERLQ